MTTDTDQHLTATDEHTIEMVDAMAPMAVETADRISVALGYNA
jgi:hypothetical protein